MSVNPILLDAIKIEIFRKNYLSLYPGEIQPTDYILRPLFNLDGVTIFLSPMNLIAYIKVDGGYEIIAHWCNAHKNLPKSDNMQAFFEVLRLVKRLGSVYISNLNESYLKATTDAGNGIRRFK